VKLGTIGLTSVVVSKNTGTSSENFVGPACMKSCCFTVISLLCVPPPIPGCPLSTEKEYPSSAGVAGVSGVIFRCELRVEEC